MELYLWQIFHSFALADYLSNHRKTLSWESASCVRARALGSQQTFSLPRLCGSVTGSPLAISSLKRSTEVRLRTYFSPQPLWSWTFDHQENYDLARYARWCCLNWSILRASQILPWNFYPWYRHWQTIWCQADCWQLWKGYSPLMRQTLKPWVASNGQ